MIGWFSWQVIIPVVKWAGQACLCRLGEEATYRQASKDKEKEMSQCYWDLSDLGVSWIISSQSERRGEGCLAQRAKSLVYQTSSQRENDFQKQLEQGLQGQTSWLRDQIIGQKTTYLIARIRVQILLGSSQFGQLVEPVLHKVKVSADPKSITLAGKTAWLEPYREDWKGKDVLGFLKCGSGPWVLG